MNAADHLGMSAFTASARTDALQRLRAWVPRGHALPEPVWRARHRGLTLLLWAHVPALALFALAMGNGLPHALVEVTPLAFCALLARAERLGRQGRAAAVTVGLLTCSAILVHLWEGTTEAHFHYFVMIVALAAYEEWFPYLLAFGYVVLQHGLMGMTAPGTVFAHEGAGRSEPWLWAGIHGGFVLALAIASIATWRANEGVRAHLVASERRFHRAFHDAPVCMALVDEDGRFLDVNRALLRETRYEEAELRARRIWDLCMPDVRAEHRAAWPPRTDVRDAEFAFARHDGTMGWGLWSFSLLQDEVGDGRSHVVQILDITQRRRAEEDLAHQASHDPLTGLPNRVLLTTRMREALARGAEHGHAVAAVFVDLDDFKVINDSLGHEAGDRLLRGVAERLRRVLRPGDVLARFGGDELVLCLERVADAADAALVVETLADALRPPFALDGDQRFVTASFGIAIAGPADAARSPEELLRDADAAMYRAKEKGKARAEVFAAPMRRRAVERLQLEAGLRDALAGGGLRLVYQPEVALADGRVAAAEALLRWDHPELGPVAPARFIPVAEQSGLIVPIGAWVLRQACRQAAQWTPLAGPAPFVSVNLSPRQLGAPDLVEQVREALRDSGLPAARLCLEITESAVMADPAAAIETLHALERLGVRVAIDDFGVGYSSLSQLRELLPLDLLKIDRSFVDGVCERPEDRAIVTAIVQMARSLGVASVAEGVERPEQAAVLRALGCDLGQGYHFGRPEPATAMTARLAQPAPAPALGGLLA